MYTSHDRTTLDTTIPLPHPSHSFFDLDPNRVADLVLDALEADAGNHAGT
jgi:hypothetical protein